MALFLELCNRAWAQKLERWATRPWKKRLTIYLAVSMQYTSVTDRRTNRQTPADGYSATFAVSSRGKEEKHQSNL